MNYFEVQDFVKQIYPNQNISIDFDEKCIRFIETTYTDGIPNVWHHFEYNKVKVTVDGVNQFYLNIIPHRITSDWKQMKNTIINMPDPKVA